MRSKGLLIAGIAGLSVMTGASALGQGTNCRWIGSVWNCQPVPAPPAPPPVQVPDARSMMDAFRAGREDRERQIPRREPPVQNQALTDTDIKAAFCVGFFFDFTPFPADQVPPQARPLANRLSPTRA